MASNSKQSSGTKPGKLSAVKPNALSKVRKSEQGSDSSLLSPLALMALGLAGGANAALSSGGANALPEKPDSPISAEQLTESPPTTVAEDLQQQASSLAEDVLAQSAGDTQLELALAFDEPANLSYLTGDPATVAEPVQLAQATVAGSAAVQTATTVAVESAATATAVASGLGGLAVLTGVAALAFAGAAVSKSSSDSTPTQPVSPADTTPPAAPTITLATNSGIATDSITNIGSVNVAGLEAGATWQYSTNGGTSWTTGSGSSITLSGDGAKSVIVRQTDAAGNVSASSGALAFTLDTAAAAPTASLAVDSGVVGDGITNNGTVNVTGLEAGATWQYSTNGGTNWTTGAGSSFTLTGDGAKSVTVRQTDVAGNVSASSSALMFTINTVVLPPTPVPDTTPPSAPIASLATNSGLSTDSITNVGMVNVSGLEAGATWQYSTNAGTSWTTGSASSFTLSGDGAKSVIVRQTDAAGNVSTSSTALAFTLDTAAASPVAALAVDSGVAGDGITNNATVNVTGLEAGATWQYSTNGGSSWTAGSGTSFTLAGDGAKSVIVRQTDVAGNVSASSSALAFTIDSAAAAPTVTLGTDSGLGSDSITNVGTVNVAGLEAGATWQYSTSGGTSWSNGSGTSFTLTGDGAKSVIVRQTDATGNVGASSAALSFTLDTTVTAPTATLAANSGITTDSITNAGTVNVAGLEAGATWQYSTDGGTSWTAGTGSTFALTGDGAKSVIVRQTDAAGNLSASSSALAFNLDTAATAPTASLAVDSGVVGDGITNNGTVNVAGLEAGATWQYSTNGGTNWTTGTGSSFTLTGDGAKSVTVRQTDVAGNLSTSSGALAFTLDTVVPPPPDTTPPSAPTITLASDSGIAADSITNAGTVNVAGLEAGATWQYSTNAGVSWTTGSGSSFTLSGDGAKSVTVHQTDAANNTSAASGALAFTLDTAASNVVSLAAHSVPKTIELTYDGALDATNLPPTTAFTVTTGGSANAVASIAVAGSVMTLTMTSAFGAGAVSLSYTDPTAGNDATAIQDLAGNDAVSFASGVVADGYVRGASVYIDTNRNGTADPGTDYFVGTTDAGGNFFIPTGAPSGSIIAIGGVNIDTGVPNTMPLKAPEGSTTINPLTTLVEAVVQASGGTTSAAAAAAAVATNLGLTVPAGQTLLGYDPFSAGDLTAQKAAAQVATIITLAENAVAGAGSAVVSNLVAELNNASSSGSTLNLADSSTIDSMLGNSLAGASAQVQSAIADASTAIGNAASLSAIATAQSQALDTVAAQAPSLSVAANTNDTTPSVRVSFNTSATDGTAAVVGDALVLKDGGIQIGTATTLTADDVAAGYKDLTANVLAEGNHSLSATLTDQAGNTGAASVAAAVNIDTQAPSAPILNAVAGDDLIGSSEQTSTVSGGAEANATVNLSVGSNSHTVTANNAGVWTYTLNAADISAMGQGSETLSATATDLAGNVSSAGTRAISVDTVAPTITLVVTGADDNVTPNTGNITAGSTTNDNTLGLSGTLSGTLGTGEAVFVYDGATRLGEATVSTTTWTFNTASLGNATHSFSARVEDAAGNIGTGSSAYSVTVNAAVPSATATVTAVTDDIAQVTGTIASAGLTNDNAPVLTGAIVGTLGSDIVVIYDGASRLGSASVTGSNWSYAPTTLSSGNHSFTAVIESAGGNQGAASSAYAIAVDTTAPLAPSINTVAVDNVVNSAEQTAVISGSAEAGSTLDLSIGGNTRSVTTNGSGAWSYTLTPTDIGAMGEGAETLSATATDVAGNVGVAGTRMISVDTVAPTTTINTVAGDNAVNATELASGVTVTGSSEAGAQIALTLGTGNIRSVTADGTTGAWTYSLNSADIKAMGQGNETLSATATDAAGNTGAASTRAISIDSAAPALTSFSLAAASDSGTVGDGKSNVATPTIEFTAENGATLEVDQGQGAGYVAAGTGTGSAQTLLMPTAFAGDRSYTVSLRATDAAGNTTVRSGSYVFDGAAPNPPTIAGITDDVGTIKGIVADKGSSDDTVLVINGSAEAYASVTVYDNVTKLGTAVSADKSGAWSFTTPTLTSGVTYAFNAKATDANGNTSGASTNQSVTIDTLRPTATVVLADTALKAGETSGVTITFNEAVTGFDNTDLTVVNGALSAVASTDSGITWTATYTPTVNLTDTSNVITLANTGVADLAGNAGVGTTDSANYTIDTLRPTATVVLADTALKAGETSGVTITFNEAVTGFDNTDLTVVNGTLSAVSSADSGITWTATYTPTADVTDTTNVITLANTGVADLAGNAGVGTTDSANYTIDTLRPAATVVLADTALKTGETSGVTITFNEAVTGFDNTDLTVVNGALSAVASADSGITWTATYTPTADVTDTTNVVTLANTGVADLAGNAGVGTTDSANYTIDTLRPTATVVMADTALKAGETSGVTITFNEAITGFDNADLTIVNGTLSAVASTDSGVTWTATYTPTANVTDTSNLITLANTAVADLAGNAGVGTTDSANYTIDTLRPTATVVMADTALKAGETSGVTITFNEAVTGFDNTDLTVVNGTLSAVASADSGVTWTATYTPTADLTDTSNVITLANTGVADLAGNAGVGTTDSANYMIDTSLPIITPASPVDNGLSLGLASNLILGANETVVKGTGTVSLYASGTGGDTLVESIDVSSTQLAISGTGANTQISINPTADLIKDQAYYVKMSAGALVDVAGNSWAGITDNTSWNFTGAGATVLIDPVSTDNIVNLTESGSAITVTGTLGAEPSVLAAYLVSDMAAVLHPASGPDVALTNLSYTYNSGNTGTWSAVIPQSALSGTTTYELLVAFTGSTGAAASIAGMGMGVVKVDTVVAAPTLSLATNSGSTSDSITNVGTVNVADLETNATWQYSTDGGTNWSAGTGTSATLTGDGAKSITVRQTDVAGNTSTASSALAFTIDGTAPAAPTLALTTNSGNTSDSISNVGTVDVAGLETNTTWQYSTDGGTNWSAGTGTSVTLTGDGAKSITVKQTDVAGNTSTASSALAFTLDGTAPAAPALTLATNSGSTSDSITNVGFVNLTDLETGASWQFSTDGGTIWGNGDGTSVQLTGDGAKSITVRQTDVAGNTSTVSSALAFTIDGTAPAAPTLALATNSGSTSDSISNVGTVNLTGLETNATWQYSTDGGTSWSSGTGTSVTLTGDGAKSITVKQTDVAGNTGTASTALAFTLDSTAPAAPTLALTTDSALVGDALTNVGTVDVTGLETGASWKYSTDGGTSWTAGSGTSVTLTGDGAKSIAVQQTDVAGNTSVASGAMAFRLDATAPPALTLALTTDSGLSDGITNVGTFNVSNLQGDTNWQYSTNGGTSWVSAMGTSATLTGDGDKSVTVRQSDMAGNFSPVSGPLNFTLDTIAPNKGVITAIVDNSGSTSDKLTNDSTPVITITADAGMKIVLQQNGTAVDPTFYTAVETSTPGTYTVTIIQPLADDGYGLLVKDVAGNFTSLPPSGTSDPAKFRIDTTAPSEPGVTAIEVNSGSASDRVTSDTTPVLTVTAESGATLLIGQNGVAIDSSLYTVAESGSSPGTYTITVGPAGLAEGGYGLVAMDAAGNKSATPVSGSAATFLIDATAPAKPSVTAIDVNGGSTTDLLTNDKTPVLTVTAEPKAYLALGTVSGSTFTPLSTQPTVVESSSTPGTYTVTVNSDLTDGLYVLRAVDQAGNASSLPGVGDSAGFAIDSVAPSVSIGAPTVNSSTGVVTLDFTFNEAVTGFDATAVTVGNGSKSTFTTTDASHYSLAIAPTSTSSPQALTVDVAGGVATDAAGNANTAAAQFLASVLYGTSGANTLTVGSALDHIFLGGGNDVVKFASAADSTVASTDSVMDAFGAGDKIDLSALLGTGGSGYTAFSLPNAGTNFVDIANPVLSTTVTKIAGVNTTVSLVSFDVTLDASSYNGQKLEGLNVDLDYNAASVKTITATSPLFDFIDGTTEYYDVKYWEQLLGITSDGRIQAIAQLGATLTPIPDPVTAAKIIAANPVISANGVALHVDITLNAIFTSFSVGLTGNGSTFFTTSAGSFNGGDSYNLNVGNVAELKISQDVGALTAPGDNQLHMASNFDAASNITHLQVQYDTNSTFGATALSSIIALDFDGDVRANLTPASLTYI